MFHRGCNTVLWVRAESRESVGARIAVTIVAALLICCGLAPAGLEGAQVVVDDSIITDTNADNAVATSGGPPTKHLLVSSFQCYLPDCDYENAVLRYDAVTGAFLNVHIPTITGPYGMALQPRRETLLVVSRTDNAVYEYHARTGAFIRQLIAAGAEGLNSPQYILVAPNGNLLVTSTQTAGNLGKFNGVLEFNGKTGAFVREFVDGGSILFVTCTDPLCLQGPNSMAFGPTGSLYVTSEVNHSVIEYNGTSGAYVGHFLHAARLISPVGLAIRPAGVVREGNVVATSNYPRIEPPANDFDDRILEFDKTSRALVSIADGGFVGSVIRPGPIGWGADGNLLVAEHTGTIFPNYADRIRKFNRDTGVPLGNFTAANDTYSHFDTAMFQVAYNFADGDYDHDGDVDLADIAAFQRCSGLSPSTACKTAFDDNLSGNIGDADFVAFFQKVRGPRHSCVNNAGCSDDNPCTTDACIGGECIYSKVANGTPCPDSLFCNGAETCSAGFCAPAPPCVDAAHCDELNNRCLSCVTNAECNDGNPCTNDTCIIGTGCQHQNNTSACSDGNACTTNDQCSGGLCVGGPPPVCNDGNLCTNDVCDNTLGCIFIHNLVPCSDGNNCTLQDFCLQGTCRSGPLRDCADTNICTTDSCDSVLGCRNLNNTFPCNDNNACTTSDACSAGVCRGTQMNCNDNVICTVDSCSGGVCVYTPQDSTCSNGLACDGAEWCDAVLDCRPGTALNCNDGIACTSDGCDQVGGCTHTPNHGACNDGNVCTTDTCSLATGCVFTNNSNSCNDGNACTTGDSCVGGTCTGSPVVCTASDQCHNAGTCNPATGVCSNPDKPNGTSCNDGSACTTGETCQAGTCTGGSPVVCTASDQCHNAGTCNPATGVCSNPAKPNGTTCNDGSACTQSDTCQAGTCTGGSPVVCTALDQCHNAGTCNPATGLCSNPNSVNGTACNDDDACTQTDSCQDGSCVGGNAVVCTPLDQCHVAGTCNPATGLCSDPNAPDGVPCGDSSECTQTDTCQGGICVGGNDVVCSASDDCHDAGTCNPATGLCSNPNSVNGTACSDDDACTQTDTCQSGNCVGGNAVVCTPSDQCHVAGVCDPLKGLCSDPEAPDGAGCNDGDACTQTDTCQAGTCMGASPVVCTASDQCHVVGTCNPGTGVCSNPPKADGTTCSDGSACTQSDTCQAGVCTGGSSVVCTALDQCHDAGTCNPATGLCSNPNSVNGTACNDDDACTQTDSCQDGSCVGGNSVVCTPLDQCHVAGTCNPATGLCSDPNAPDGVPCGDSSECTQTDTCQGGVCVGGNDVVCSASDDCHDAGVCDPETGVCSDPAKADGATCDDGDACTQTDNCQSGNCVGDNDVVCTPSDQCHVAGVCNPLKGLCSDPEAPDGAGCNDGDACTQTDTCQAGTCMGASPVVCTALDQCHDVGTCNPGTGVCSDPPKADGTTCSDESACTQTDTCQAGTCTGASPVVCTALDQCHDVGVCDPGTGVCSDPAKADGASCDDGDECTQPDTCQGGVCTSGSNVVCTASDDCHDVGVCDPETGVCSNPARADGASCDDSDECTLTDTCQGGVCTSGSDVVCTASDECHDVGICDPETGLCSDPEAPNGTTCDDGDECTLTDTCQGGVCTSGSDVVCTASDDCHDAGVCDPETGVCSDPAKADGASCDDGDECTLTDTCQGGVCISGSDVVCTAFDDCHDVGVCDPGTGLCSDPAKADGASCDDGDECTVTDTCQSGICTSGSPVVCTALDQCHNVGVCDPGTGLCSNPAKPNIPSIDCDDTLFCTVSDRCFDGICVGVDRDCPGGCDEENDVCNP